MNTTLLRQIIDQQTQQDPDLRLLARAITPMLAKATWTVRASIYKQFQKFLNSSDSRPDLPLDMRASLFILKEKNKLKNSSKLQYAKMLKGMARFVGLSETPTLDMCIRSLRVATAKDTIKQAELITPEQQEHLLNRAFHKSPRLWLSIYMVIKTCSRWGDIATLTKDNFVIHHTHLEPNEILIQWGTGTKTSRTNPFRATGFVVLREDNHRDQIVQLKAEIRKLKKDELFCPKSTQKMTKWLQKDKVTAKLTCHSFKRTSLNKLMEFAMAGQLAPTIVPLMAKHQDKNLQHFPESTIRYIANKVALAKMFKTQEATRLL